MSAAVHATATVLPGQRIEVNTPGIKEGETVEVYIVPADVPMNLEQRRAFLRLPMEERGRILEEQAAHLEEHYREDESWREIQDGDIVEF
jgi:hypothetical protein